MNPDTKKKIDKVLKLVSQGMSVKQACKKDDTCSEVTFNNWLAGDDEKGQRLLRYARAREGRADSIFEEVLEISDNVKENKNAIAKARLMIDSRWKYLAKLAPSKYGDKLDVNHGGNVIVEIKK
jgi:transposase